MVGDCCGLGVPGYAGHVPYYRDVFGKTFNESCMLVSLLCGQNLSSKCSNPSPPLTGRTPCVRKRGAYPLCSWLPRPLVTESCRTHAQAGRLCRLHYSRAGVAQVGDAQRQPQVFDAAASGPLFEHCAPRARLRLTRNRSVPAPQTARSPPTTTRAYSIIHARHTLLVHRTANPDSM
jgi:hypothetical protein